MYRPIFSRATKFRQFAFVFVALLSIPLKAQIIPAAMATHEYIPLLKGRSVGFVGNHTSLIGETHLVDHLIAEGVRVRKVFSPEHGFRGNAAAGEKVENGIDPRTGLPVVSLYGSHKKPTPEDLEGIDLILFDIQDVGVRFYTYISTLTLVMEAAAENGIPVVVLDRPNPLGWYIDGPVLDPVFSSFVGMHPVPVVYGMTIGEYARMVNGERWLKDGVQCDLKVIPCKGYTHASRYELPVPPSPNLPNSMAITLYPSLCFFEGTPVSIGRGTEMPFQVIGAPWLPVNDFSFTPKPTDAAPHPKLEGVECRAVDLRNFAKYFLADYHQLYLYWLVDAYAASPDKSGFFTSFFDKLAGTDELRKMIQAGYSVEDIRSTWEDDIRTFKEMRAKYLIYPEN